MNVAYALLLVKALAEQEHKTDSKDIDFVARQVLVLARVLERNLGAEPELQHGLVFARSLAVRNEPFLAIARLKRTLETIERREALGRSLSKSPTDGFAPITNEIKEKEHCITTRH